MVGESFVVDIFKSARRSFKNLMKNKAKFKFKQAMDYFKLRQKAEILLLFLMKKIFSSYDVGILKRLIGYSSDRENITEQNQ